MPRRGVNISADRERVEVSDAEEEAPLSGKLMSFLEGFARAQAESNRQLVESLLDRNPVNDRVSPPSQSSQPSPYAVSRSGNFANCTARFNGLSRDSEVLEAFIDSIEIYKDCTNIHDDHALRGLPMLLEGEAAVWYRGIRSSINSWDDALKRLRSMYGISRPA